MLAKFAFAPQEDVRFKAALAPLAAPRGTGADGAAPGPAQRPAAQQSRHLPAFRPRALLCPRRWRRRPPGPVRARRLPLNLGFPVPSALV